MGDDAMSRVAFPRQDKHTLADDGNALVYTFDTQAERTGIATLLRRLGDLGIGFKDLHSSESSLEEIFVSLVHEGATGARA